MDSQSLIATNPYLKNPVRLRAMILKNVASSSAIEGIRGILPFLKKSFRLKSKLTSRKRAKF
jgi:hypothetical protein